MKIYSKSQLNNFDYSLTYDDISLIPSVISTIKSRMDAVTKCRFLGKELNVPVLSSPMDTVTGIEMSSTLKKMGCVGILNRFDSSLKELIDNDSFYQDVEAVSIGLTTSESNISKLAGKVKIICIDTANANNREVLNKCSELKSRFDVKVILGNIAHGATLKDLVNAGADAVRIGIGGGSVCTTSMQTGIGIGQVSSLLSVYHVREEEKLDIGLIADGGIKSPGDVVKAIALGADVVMLGRMLAGTRETPGEVIKYDDMLWKKYRGSASFGVKMKGEFIEGEETMVPYKGTVINVINSISDGLRSALSYMNCSGIEQLKKVETFAVLSHSSYIERLPKK